MHPAVGTALQVVAGASHTCAIRSGDNELFCWGKNDRGQVGNGTTSDQLTPVAVLEGVELVAPGKRSTSAPVDDGTVRCCGADGKGQLGNGDGTGLDQSTPVEVIPQWTGDVLELVSGERHTCVRVEGGGLWCWGRTLLGDGSGAGTYAVPTEVPLAAVLPDVAPSSLAAGWLRTCLVGAQTSLAWCWGDNSKGVLGNGETSQQREPAVVLLPCP